ncbi:PP2C family protein-serine/threonine phosphatase [Benzoatithermus flavus]|uniref:SpoIIE family protein phosphatase n=1 Tax=Benzoatithermus flavus TaxID=3108223 RepID=A0ABU8XSE2_9PROT
MTCEPVDSRSRRVVLADDDVFARAIIGTLLRSLGYEVIEAGNGDEAWACLERSEAGILVTDWVMPDCDGPELCRRIRERSGHYVYVLMLTSHSHRSAVVEGLEAGADDFLRKPPDPEELRVRLKTGERIVRLERQLSQRNERLRETNARLREAYERIERDLAAAARSQESLLPRPGFVSGIAVDWMFEPSSHVGGDVFDVVPLGGGRLLFFHIDVVGHGVRAALHSFAVHGLLSATLGRRPAEGDVLPIDAWWRHALSFLKETNERFCSVEAESSYFTMLLGLIDGTSGTGSLIQAGHPSPILLHAREARAELLGEGGLPVGLIPDAWWEPLPFVLAPGDRLALYSDGIVEAERLGEGLFSEARLARHLVITAGRPLAEVVAGLRLHLRDWRQGAAPDDDLSLLMLERPLPS